MVFSSTIFLFIFLPTTLIGYYLINKKFRNAFLLLMSLIFYAVGEPTFVFIMMASILVNYAAGIAIWKTMNSSKLTRRIILTVVVALNLSLLFYYKYFDFTIANINSIFGSNIALKNIALPIGISFFTFQGMSYTLDVYMHKAEVQKNPLNVALYIALFPQLVAGPIVRYTDVNMEIDERRENIDDFALGISRFAIGLTKKIILSNSFALLADEAFGMAPEALGPGMAWLGALAYTLQIYFDFSGYSDMAIGLGLMFGFHFLENFDYPYTATDVTVFWRKWHISLSSWFRDYVYIPLGGNRRGNVYVNLFIVFLLTGIWHGASWNFLVWGLWHGLFLIIERILRKHNVHLPLPKKSKKTETFVKGLYTSLKWMYTMLVVIIGWVFFRAADLTSAIKYLGCMIGLGGADTQQTSYAFSSYLVMFLLGIICATPILQKLKKVKEEYVVPQKAAKILEPLAIAVLLVIGICFTVTSTYNPFIYFNF